MKFYFLVKKIIFIINSKSFFYFIELPAKMKANKLNSKSFLYFLELLARMKANKQTADVDKQRICQGNEGKHTMGCKQD